jgi:beta-lactamase regulating signal transducer with metallopeptidase domain
MSDAIDNAGETAHWILQSSWQAALLVGVVVLVQLIMRNQLSPAWKYGLWLLVIARLCLPILPESSFSVFNYGFSSISTSSPVAQFAENPAAADPPSTQSSGDAAPEPGAPSIPATVVPVTGGFNTSISIVIWLWMAGATALLLPLLWRSIAIALRLRRLRPIIRP